MKTLACISHSNHLAGRVLNVSSDPKITFAQQQPADEDYFSDTVIHDPCDSQENVPNDLPNRNLTIHYSHSFNDIIEAFSDHKIVTEALTVRRILPNNS